MSEKFSAAEFVQNPEEKSRTYLDKAYLEIHEKDPAGLSAIETAERIIEVLSDPTWVDRDTAIRAADEIMGLRYVVDPVYDARAKELILQVENGIAQVLFPDKLKNDEVHYSYWEHAFREYDLEHPEKDSSSES